MKYTDELAECISNLNAEVPLVLRDLDSSPFVGSAVFFELLESA